MTEEISNFKVTDRQSFIELVNLLHDDFLKNPSSWENDKLDRFLEALAAYANDIQGYYNNTHQKVNADQPSWKVFADILRGASIYE